MIPISEDDQNDIQKRSKIVRTFLKKDTIIISDHQDARIIYDNGYYGTLQKDKTLILNFDEALHLLERGVITILDEKGNEISVGTATKLFSEMSEGFWRDYLVYKDLRNRGYIVGQGISNLVKYRLYPRGAQIGKDIAKTLICPLAEGKTINLEKLDDIITQTQSLKKKVLIACVDRLGDVSYYELQSLFK
ncbi:MAG: tRNA-intron lyase [Candidatus Thorarchaeota archaeon]